jgi:hypothetical protein
MNQPATLDAGPDWHKIQQIVKWLVYAFLIVNFVFYIIEDATRGAHTLHAGSTFLDWTSAFATTIDESAWFLLLAMFEIETYIIEDDDLEGWVTTTLHGVRMFSYVLLAHTIYAFLTTLLSLQPTVIVEDASSLCDLSGTDVSYVYNLEYTEIDEQNCSALSGDSQFYWVAEDPVVTDASGLALERNLALVDLIEATLWLLAVLSIEIVVRLQGRGVTGGRVISMANRATFVMYAGIIAFGVYWASLSHWLYLWDELVWILGFIAIEFNLSEWRDDMLEEQATT